MFQFFNPKGTLYYELFQLAYYWANIIRLPSNQVIEEKITYGAHPRQYLLSFQPKNKTAPCKGTIVYLHGGAWRFGSPELFRSTAQFFTDMNYSVILPSHRRCPTYNYRHIKADLVDILKACKTVVQSQSQSTHPFIVGGMSAGGHLSAMVFLDQEIMTKAGWQTNDLSGTFLLGAPLHLEKMANSQTLKNLAGRRPTPLFQEANPYNYIQSEDHRPLLIVHGKKDGMVEFASTEAFVRKLKQTGFTNLTYEPVNNGSHIDVASYVFTENSSRKILQKWLDSFH
ncbi:MAG: hypothetical protein DHS20C18_09600 [Saprospiraceae bacterium]|nr:MAG: hypothetical protein DHS20C18_09600 [Saprospiraceae bacterium]